MHCGARGGGCLISWLPARGVGRSVWASLQQRCGAASARAPDRSRRLPAAAPDRGAGAADRWRRSLATCSTPSSATTRRRCCAPCGTGGVRAVRHRLDRRGAGGARRCCPMRRCHFMHPVKSTEAIAEAYHRHGVRRFVLDHPDELAKIVAATGGAGDLELFVRLAVPGEGAAADAHRQVRRRRSRRPRRWCARRARYAQRGRPHLPCRLAVRRARGLRAGDRARGRGGAPCRPGRRSRRRRRLPGRYQGDEPAFEAFVAAIASAVAPARADLPRCSASRAACWSPTAPRS